MTIVLLVVQGLNNLERQLGGLKYSSYEIFILYFLNIFA
jgi:hypothetical protein